MLESVKVNVKTISNEHLEQFMHSPDIFLQECLLHKNRNRHITWERAVKAAVKQILKEYFQLPVQERTALSTLKLLERQWHCINVRLFQSKMHYYTVLAKVTDYLLQELGACSHIMPPLFLYEKYRVAVAELGIDLSVEIDVGEWTANSYKIKKIMLDDSEEVRNAFVHLMVVFGRHAFNQLPDSIEFYCLMTGTKYEVCIKEAQYEESLHFLGLIKSTLEQSMMLNHKRVV
ncbi:hypothetical protein [Priestia abyssalis]|uniref:hypothetical protein n=1 Tax=Priestia abyssalis TaxID=1221450 RepID=UPI000995D4BB|nr:hypothetical protein [Priestia abyssalis]